MENVEMKKSGRIIRIRFDRQGYTECGSYRGIGEPIYAVWYGDRLIEVRAPNLKAARLAFAQL